MLREMRQNRNKLLELLTDPNHDQLTMEKAVNDYFSLLMGLIQPFEDNESENKLRRAIKFKWTNTLLGNGVREKQDTVFEAASMAINVGLWYTKHAAKLAAKEEPDMEEAKEVHKCLRIAAGIFTYVKDELIGRLSDNTENGIDTDSRILEAYLSQCTGEAQEVTLARAIEMKHSPGLVAALAHETSQLYQRADDALQSLDVKVVGKWRKYFQLKSEFYKAYAYCYNGETLLQQDKCGEAVRGLQEGVKCYEKAELLCKEYASTKGLGTFARPANHLFFRRLGPVLKRTLEKCERENGMMVTLASSIFEVFVTCFKFSIPPTNRPMRHLTIPIDITDLTMNIYGFNANYHQKVAYDPPILELKATYGLAAPEAFTPPALNPLWSKEVYTNMDAKMAPKPENDKDKEKKGDKPAELPPVKEKETPMSEKDPGTFSGCVVS